MKTKGKTLKESQLEQVQAEKPPEFYIAPQVEVIDIELTQNILGSDTLPDMPGYDW